MGTVPGSWVCSKNILLGSGMPSEVGSSVQAGCVLGWFGLVSVVGRGLSFPQLGRLWGSVGVERALSPIKLPSEPFRVSAQDVRHVALATIAV